MSANALFSLLATALTLACATRAPLQSTPAGRPAETSATPSSSIAGATAGMQRVDGLIPVHLDRLQDKLLLELPRDSMRVLLFITEATGLGSNPIGLDRGANGGEFVARFDRAGNHVLVVFENWSYRSSALDNPDHRRTVMESFPPSTVAALPLTAAEDGKLLVDATDFIFRDWLDVAGTLARSEQGEYAVARDRSSVHRPYTRGFPDNTEIDVSLTFAARNRPGPIVADMVPDGRAFTIRQHLSFVRLPDDGYRPRELDPRVGFFGITFRDYAQPIDRPLEQRWIARHRLERVDPADPTSAIREPVVYYIDRGIPEPVRTATIEGAKWWEEAFDRAGLRGGFQVRDLPDGADPMDARYNVVQWINRHERGWSIGGSLGDPRTGEILKAMARMDSHRARTSYNLYAGLVGVDAAAGDTGFALGRVRQVTAHEIGHTLGIAHNYIASTYGRGSVMDYPPPRARLGAGGEIDLSAAYDDGPGEYDVWAVRWGYGIFPPGSEQDSLRAIVREGLAKGFLFLSDADARPEFAADPRTSLWDDAESANAFLKHQMDVRRVAISRFGERNIREGEPVALLQERFVPVYFFHRFAITAVAKTIGGMEYWNAMRGDGLTATRPIPAAEQRAALAMLTDALAPEALAIPDTVLSLLAPRAFSYGNSIELFASRTRPAFDELGAARTLSQMVIDAVLQRERAARLVQYGHRSADALTLAEAIDSLAAATWGRRVGGGRKLSALARVTQRALADRLLQLAADRQAAPEVRAMAELKLAELRREAGRRVQAGSAEDRAHWGAIAGDFTRWIERRELPAPTPALQAPPGDPFGEEPGA